MFSKKCYSPTHSKEEFGACTTLFNVLVEKTYIAIKSNPISPFCPFCWFFILRVRQDIIYFLVNKKENLSEGLVTTMSAFFIFV